MKNYIHLNGKDIDLDNISSTQDLDNITDTCVHIMGVVLVIGTSGIKEDNKRVEFIMTQAGKIGGAMAKHSLTILANEKATIEKPKPEEVVGEYTNA